MGLTDLFSKLIVEHGSAEVQAKHIALFKDQLALADKKITELETENATLKSQLENSESTIHKLAKENEELRSKIQEYEQPTEEPTHNNLLDEAKLTILKLLLKTPKTPKEHIAQVLKVDVPVAEFHLTELKELKMVKRVVSGSAFQPVSGWSLDQEGTRYLLEQKMA